MSGFVPLFLDKLDPYGPNTRLDVSGVPHSRRLLLGVHKRAFLGPSAHCALTDSRRFDKSGLFPSLLQQAVT